MRARSLRNSHLVPRTGCDAAYVFFEGNRRTVVVVVVLVDALGIEC